MSIKNGQVLFFPGFDKMMPLDRFNKVNMFSRTLIQKFYKNVNVSLMIVFIFVFLLSGLEAEQPDEYDEVVSLGFACQVAYQTKLNGFRTHAYPFDVLITPYESMLLFIVNKGVNFLEPSNLHVLEVLPGGVLSVLEKGYNIQMIHDFTLNFANYNQVKAKYDRRIKRFFDLLASNKRVLFIRINLNYYQAIELDNILHTLYPQLPYTILALNDDEQSKQDWHLERVRNFYLRWTGGWDGDYARWKEILNHFKLAPTASHCPSEN